MTTSIAKFMNNLELIGDPNYLTAIINDLKIHLPPGRDYTDLFDKIHKVHYNQYPIHEVFVDIVEAFSTSEHYSEPIDYKWVAVLEDPPNNVKNTFIHFYTKEEGAPTKRELKEALMELLELVNVTITWEEDGDRFRVTLYDDDQDDDNIYDFLLYEITG